MNAIKLIGIAAITFAITSCTSSGAEKSASEANHDTTTCTTHEHHHNNTLIIGVAQEGNYASGKITITTIPGCEPKEFDYSKSNQDQIAAWQAGDTVSIFIEHHHHGEMAHDSITAIKLGVKECCEAHNNEIHEHHNHENCNEHKHNH